MGFEIVTLDGQRGILARTEYSSAHRVGRYGVDLETLDRIGVAALQMAARSGLLVVVHEIGKMELYSKAFREAIFEGLEADGRLLGTILLASHPWADRIKRDRWVSLLTMTRDNHQATRQRVSHWLAESPPS